MVSNSTISNRHFILTGILILSALQATATNQTLVLCRGDGITYSTKDITGTSIAWKWTFEGGDIPGSNQRITPVVTYNVAGNYKTYNETTYPTGPISYDTFIVIVHDWPIPAFYFPTDTGYCSGNTFNLTLNASTFPGIDYKWSTGATTQSITINAKGTYWVDMVINSMSGACDSARKQVNVKEYISPTVNLGNDQLMCQSQIIVLDAKGVTGDTYLWTPNNEKTRQISVSLPGTYSVTITTSDNCKATDQIELIDSCPHLIFIPNAVSPNADLLNDIFDKVWNFTPKEYTFSIYNRWGELLFETNDMKKGWDCKVKDELVQQDVYVYKIIFLDTDKKWYTYRGTFFVVR